MPQSAEVSLHCARCDSESCPAWHPLVTGDVTFWCARCSCWTVDRVRHEGESVATFDPPSEPRGWPWHRHNREPEQQRPLWWHANSDAAADAREDCNVVRYREQQARKRSGSDLDVD